MKNEDKTKYIDTGNNSVKPDTVTVSEQEDVAVSDDTTKDSKNTGSQIFFEAPVSSGDDVSEMESKSYVVENGKDASIMTKEEFKKKADKREFWHSVLHLFIKIGTICAAVYVLLFIVFGVGFQTNSDMGSNVKPGDIMLFYRLENDYRTGDVVTFQAGYRTYVSVDTNMSNNGYRVSGRIVALTGDTIRFHAGVVSKFSDGTNEYMISNVDVYVNNHLSYTVKCSEDELSKYALDEDITLETDEFMVLYDDVHSAKREAFRIMKSKEFDGLVFTIIRKDNI